MAVHAFSNRVSAGSPLLAIDYSFFFQMHIQRTMESSVALTISSAPSESRL